MSRKIISTPNIVKSTKHLQDHFFLVDLAFVSLTGGFMISLGLAAAYLALKGR